MKTQAEQAKETGENVAYFEAEILSLKEELARIERYRMSEMWPTPCREKFVALRIARLEKELPKLQEEAKAAKEHLDWLERINAPKR